MAMIPISKPQIGEEEVQAAVAVLKSGNLTQGKNVEFFEKEFSSYIGTKYSVATSSGTSALQVGIESLEIPQGSEIITTPFTFVATANSIIYNRCSPVFVDINPDTFNINPELIEKSITEKTKAVLIVHLFGQPCEMDKITKICKERGLLLIEDCAQSLGTKYKGQKTGNFGDLSTFSFYATKNITTGEGGMVSTNSQQADKLSRIIRSQGQDGQYNHVRLGFNERMTEVEAAIGRVQLKKLERLNKKRTESAKLLEEGLSKVEWLQTPQLTKGAKHSWHQYTIKMKSGRDRLLEHLAKNGVGAKVYYPVPVDMQPVYNSKSPCKISEETSKQVLSLPVHPGLSNEDIEKIIKTVKEFKL